MFQSARVHYVYALPRAEQYLRKSLLIIKFMELHKRSANLWKWIHSCSYLEMELNLSTS